MRSAAMLLALLAHCRAPAAPRPDVATPPETRPDDGGRAVLSAPRFSPDGASLVLTAVRERSAESHALLRWDLRAGALRWARPLRAPGEPDGSLHVAQSARWSADGASLVVYWSSAGALGLVDAASGTLRRAESVPAFGHSVPFGEGALLGDPLGVQVLRVGAAGDPVRLDPRPAGAFFAAVSDDGARAAIPDEGGLAVYDLRSGARLALLHHAQASPRLAVSRDGRVVAELRDGTLRVFTLGAAAVWSAPAEDTPHLALAPDGAAAAVCGDLRGGLTVFDLRGRRAPRALPTLRCQGLDWSPDGRTLAATRYDGVTLVRAEDGRALELSLRWRDGAWRAEPSATAGFFTP